MDNNALSNQQAVPIVSNADSRSILRGKYWEVTYKELEQPFTAWELQSNELATETGKTNVEVTAKENTRAVNLSHKEFLTCDFNHFNLKDSSFADCRFVDCRFVKSNFNNVKFSGCQFDTCHFLYVEFRNCQFIDCTFSNISASAEHLLFVESGIAATAFVNALVTNIAALPSEVSKDYQEYRHLSTKTKIARGIFISVRDEPELDLLFDANRCFEVALQRKRIADAYWTTAKRKLVKRNVLYRATVRPIRLLALVIIQIAGFFTDWGRSLMRSFWLLGTVLLTFGALYYFPFGQDLKQAALRALDCTFVFGYTRYSAGAHADILDYTMFLNAFFGFCWYALLVPALSKRLFR